MVSSGHIWIILFMQAMDKLISLNQNNRPIDEDETELQEGEWEMIWSSQVSFAINSTMIR